MNNFLFKTKLTVKSSSQKSIFDKPEFKDQELTIAQIICEGMLSFHKQGNGINDYNSHVLNAIKNSNKTGTLGQRLEQLVDFINHYEAVAHEEREVEPYRKKRDESRARAITEAETTLAEKQRILELRREGNCSADWAKKKAQNEADTEVSRQALPIRKALYALQEAFNALNITDEAQIVAVQKTLTEAFTPIRKKLEQELPAQYEKQFLAEFAATIQRLENEAQKAQEALDALPRPDNHKITTLGDLDLRYFSKPTTHNSIAILRPDAVQYLDKISAQKIAEQAQQDRENQKQKNRAQMQAIAKDPSGWNAPSP